MSRLIVIGASLGGVPALLQLTAALPRDLAAAVLIVLHVGEQNSILPTLLATHSALRVAFAKEGEPLRAGHIGVAPPDHHLLVAGDVVQLTRGPKEHHTRPAIDPLFRSAALAHGPAVIGVVLTGSLDDGTAGLQAIKERGGLAVVQDPEDAFASSMPASALRYVDVDHCVPLALMPMLLASLAAAPPGPAPARPNERLAHEQRLTRKEGDPMSHLSAIGSPTTYACPECHGTLWEVLDSRPQRYVCHTGHGFSQRSLQNAMATTSDEAGWNALRALQERQLLLQHMALQERNSGDAGEAEKLTGAEQKIDRQVRVLRELLEDGPEPIE